MIINSIILGKLIIVMNTLNHFIKKKDSGGSPAMLKNRSK